MSFLASLRLVRLGWRWSVGFPLRVAASELRRVGVACDTAVWWGDGSVEPVREGLAALPRGSSAVIRTCDGYYGFSRNEATCYSSPANWSV